MNASTIFVSFASGRGEVGDQPTSTAPTPNSTAYTGPDSRGPPYSLEVIFLFFMLVVFFVLGVVGNALAFYIYYQKKDKTTSTLFILSLAAADFLTCLIIIPYTLVVEILEYWVMYDLVCKAYMFCLTFNVPLSAFIMVAVGFDRYFCICHPFLYVMTVRRAKVCLVCLTVLACALGIFTALGFGVFYIGVLEPEEPTGEMTAAAAAAAAAAANSSVAGISTVSPFGYHVAANASSVLLGGGGGGGGGGSSSSSSSMSTESVLGSAEGFTFNATGEGEERGKNATVKLGVLYYGMCVSNTLIVSRNFQEVYQKCYAATFLVSFLIIALLYALIYRSILIRRAWKAKRKRMSCYNSTIAAGPETVAEETQLTNINNGNSVAVAGYSSAAGRVPTRTSVALRDRMLYANIKTAAMLFVVSVVFVICFLPSWLIGLEVLEMNYILFYFFFFNNVANPFIYAFMNRTFRDDMRQLFKRIKNRLSGW